MKKLNVEKTQTYLASKVKLYIKLIIKEYGKYIPITLLEQLNSITDYRQIIKIYDYGQINAYANKNQISMPLCADKVLNMMSKMLGYGINRNHKTYNTETTVVNNNGFGTYLLHVFISGTDTKGYYDDLLLHETVHFCGGDGSSVLKEGMVELLTRMLAQKYNLRTSFCGYPKEVKLCYKLMEIMGEDTIKRLAFMTNVKSEIMYLRETLGDDIAELYIKVYEIAEREFYFKYYSHMKEFNNILGIFKKIIFYKNIDYSQVYSIIDEYSEKLNSKNKKIVSTDTIFLLT